MLQSPKFLLAWVSALGLLAQTAASDAQTSGPGPAPTDGISVLGAADAIAKPNLVELDLRVVGKAELTGDALVKYRDAKKRVTEALDKLKLKNLTFDEHALSITAGAVDPVQQQRIINGQQQAPTKPQIEVGSTLRVKLKDVRDVPTEELLKLVGKLIDVAIDAGISFGPNQTDMLRNLRMGMGQGAAGAPLRFIVSDAPEIREKVYEQAVVDARNRATRLARLHHVKLGQALAIQEVSATPQRANAANPYAYIYGAVQQDDSEDGESGISTSLTGSSLKVKLLVRFAIASADPATAQQ